MPHITRYVRRGFRLSDIDLDQHKGRAGFKTWGAMAALAFGSGGIWARVEARDAAKSEEIAGLRGRVAQVEAAKQAQDIRNAQLELKLEFFSGQLASMNSKLDQLLDQRVTRRTRGE